MFFRRRGCILGEFLEISSEFSNNLFEHLIDILSWFCADLMVATSVGLGSLICIPYLLDIGLVSYNNDGTGSSCFFDLFHPNINILYWRLITQITYNYHLRAFLVELISDFTEINFSTEIPESHMQLGSILGQEVLVKCLYPQSGLIIVGALVVDVLAQKGGFSCLTVPY